MGEKGLKGNVVLVSPNGDQAIKINVPGRHPDGKWGYDENGRWRFLPTGKLTLNDVKNSSSKEWNERTRVRQDRRFHRLLSEGWHVATSEELAQIGKVEKKNTTIVIGTTLTGNASHGGKHASGEVEDSPNAFEQGKKQRGSRGGRQKKDPEKKRQDQKRLRIKVQQAKGSGRVAVYSPQPLEENPALLKSAEESAELLSKLVGRSAKKSETGNYD